ncbi:MAG: heavy metal-binding domain-containing protein, partial [Asticcacaulis sp.]
MPDHAPHAQPSVTGHRTFTCPMHPEVVRDAPGNCPVCGMTLVIQAEKTGTSKDASGSACCHHGHAAPHPTQLPLATDASELIFTCPMHAEIRQKGPGTCPICGMALEPEKVSLDDSDNPELTDMRRRFVVSALLSAPILIWVMGG